MGDFFYLVPLSVVLGVAGLAAFLWSLSNGQYDDLDGSAERILYDEGRPADPRTERGSARRTSVLSGLRPG